MREVLFLIGSGLKKFAKENGMNVSSGVAYGALRGYAATLSEGSGYKQIVVTTKFSDPAKVQELQSQLNQKNITREYRVKNLTFTPGTIIIVFNDTVGTMKKIAAFIDWVFPLLGAAGASTADFCGECGGHLEAGCWKLINGVAFHMHESCAEKVRNQVAEENEARKQETDGTYLMGAVGAVLGAALGAVVWALVLLGGYVASIVGLLIGWLAEKGYNLFRGRQGKGKILVLVIAIVLGVLLGTFAADAISVAQLISETEGAIITYSDIPAFLLDLFITDGEYRSAALSNIFMGLLFAGLGVFALLRKASNEVADMKFVDLP